LRLLSGTDCSLQTTITAHLVNGSAAATIGDMDGDGIPEIVASSLVDMLSFPTTPSSTSRTFNSFQV